MAISFKTGNPEARSYKVLPAGEYQFRVLDAVEKRSKAGSDMIELKLDVYKGDEQAIVYDYLVFTEKAAWKVDAFLKSCGMHPGEGVDHEIVANEFVGFEGRVKLKVGKTDKNADRNEVEAFIWEEEF